MRISDWSSDVCASDLVFVDARVAGEQGGAVQRQAVLPAVTIADERGRRARRRGVSGWKRFPAAIRAFAPGDVVETEFQHLGCGERGGEAVGVVFGSQFVRSEGRRVG